MDPHEQDVQLDSHAWTALNHHEVPEGEAHYSDGGAYDLAAAGAQDLEENERKRKSEILDLDRKTTKKKGPGYSGDGVNMSWKDEEGQKMLAALIDLRRLQRIEHSQKGWVNSSGLKIWDQLAEKWNEQFPNAKKKLSGDALNAVFDRAKKVFNQVERDLKSSIEAPDATPESIALAKQEAYRRIPYYNTWLTFSAETENLARPSSVAAYRPNAATAGGSSETKSNFASQLEAAVTEAKLQFYAEVAAESQRLQEENATLHVVVAELQAQLQRAQNR